MISRYGLDLDRILDSMAGSYLQTVRYESKSDLLCPVCGGFKNPSYHDCRSCEMIAHQAHAIGLDGKLADRVACGVYATDPDSQTLKMMYGYKEPCPVSPDYRRNIQAILALAIIGHVQCLNELADLPLSGWAMVPSTRSSPRFDQEHPLHAIISGLLPNLPEIRLASRQPKQRFLDPNAFALANSADRRLLSDNVLLIDDTWVTGGTVQSAAVRLKLEGAAQVSIYCVARIANTRYLDTLGKGLTKSFMRGVRYTGGYCPWHRKVELP
ncbi:hypothetical protein [Bifidobacterium miconisargentati]|uniref:hypothetical protein n=1 Tax=Bifidobacterium miconisargentati TaxID=2834437 RepID=UPI001BDCE80F|nr:hypothetical protein [Bifidobacterium miconisargentati]MBW3090092.1 hypothetical protein [Bifidobacterium miconisargentati]